MKSIQQADKIVTEVDHFLNLQRIWWKTNKDADLDKLKDQRKVLKRLTDVYFGRNKPPQKLW